MARTASQAKDVACMFDCCKPAMRDRWKWPRIFRCSVQSRNLSMTKFDAQLNLNDSLFREDVDLSARMLDNVTRLVDSARLSIKA